MEKIGKSLATLGVMAMIAMGTFAFTTSQNAKKVEGVEFVRNSAYEWHLSTGSETCQVSEDACKVLFPENYTPQDGELNYEETMLNSLAIIEQNGQID